MGEKNEQDMMCFLEEMNKFTKLKLRDIKTLTRIQKDMELTMKREKRVALFKKIRENLLALAFLANFFVALLYYLVKGFFNN